MVRFLPNILISQVFIIENEAVNNLLGHSWAISSITIGICRSELSVSHVKHLSLRCPCVFRDYDLSLVCTSKCDDQYLQCVSACSDADCLMECNRATVACADGMIFLRKKCDLVINIWSIFKHALVTPIVLKVAMVVTTRSVSVM